MIHGRHTTTGIDLHRTQLGEFKQLRVNLQAVTCPHVPDAALLLLARPVTGKLLARRCAYPLTGREVQEILPVAGNYTLLQLAALFGQVRVLTAQGKLRQLILAIQEGARHEIEQAMRITGDEVDRPLVQAKSIIKQLFNRRPPLARGAHKADMRTTEHAQ